MRLIVERVAARVREERDRQGRTLEAVALAAGVSRTTLARFEAGKSGIQLERLGRIVVNGLGLDWSAFMASAGDPSSPRDR